MNKKELGNRIAEMVEDGGPDVKVSDYVPEGWGYTVEFLSKPGYRIAAYRSDPLDEPRDYQSILFGFNRYGRVHLGTDVSKRIHDAAERLHKEFIKGAELDTINGFLGGKE